MNGINIYLIIIVATIILVLATIKPIRQQILKYFYIYSKFVTPFKDNLIYIGMIKYSAFTKHTLLIKKPYIDEVYISLYDSKELDRCLSTIYDNMTPDLEDSKMYTLIISMDGRLGESDDTTSRFALTSNKKNIVTWKKIFDIGKIKEELVESIIAILERYESFDPKNINITVIEVK